MPVPAISLSSTAAAAPPASSRPPAAGGLSCLFSSPATSHARPLAADEDLVIAYSCTKSSSSSSSPFKCRDHSPVSVLNGPTMPISSATSSRGGSPPLWFGDWHVGHDRLFNGFIVHALSSCVHSESELAFELDENLVPQVGSYEKELLGSAQARHRIFYDQFVVSAFYEAEKAHRGQMRASGDPYLKHCVETAVLLAEIGANAMVVSAGLLHDTIDDSFVDYDHIFGMFGGRVADLVRGVSKLSHVSKLARENYTATSIIEAELLHTMFLAMTDPAAVLIKLADRLHNMMTLDALPMVKQQRFAKETLEIFVPLASRLGISSWKEQLENICFKHLYPEEHMKLSSKLVNLYDEVLSKSAIEKLEKGLRDEGVPYHKLSGRHKSLYSIYKKMLKKNLSMEEILDIYGLRLVVDNEEDCYRALDVVHRLWPQVEGRFKDYIRQPKLNKYQSLHTVVRDVHHPFEVQIRTQGMHHQAEFGLAAHWIYKEGCCKNSFVHQLVEWARWVLTWVSEAISKDWSLSSGDSDVVRPSCSFPSHSEDCPYSYTRQCNYDGPVYIIMLENEKMHVEEFTANATMMDLMERVGITSAGSSPVSFPLKEELRPRVNHEPVYDPTQKLYMGDVVELRPALPHKSLTVYREEIQRMYEQGGRELAGQGGRKS